MARLIAITLHVQAAKMTDPLPFFSMPAELVLVAHISRLLSFFVRNSTQMRDLMQNLTRTRSAPRRWRAVSFWLWAACLTQQRHTSQLLQVWRERQYPDAVFARRSSARGQDAAIESKSSASQRASSQDSALQLHTAIAIRHFVVDRMHTCSASPLHCWSNECGSVQPMQTSDTRGSQLVLNDEVMEGAN